MQNERFLADEKSSSFNLKNLFNAFIAELIDEGFKNLIENHALVETYIKDDESDTWLPWERTPDTLVFSQGSRYVTVNMDEDESVEQDITGKIEANKVYTVFFKGSVTEDLLIEVDPVTATDLINPDDLSQADAAFGTMTVANSDGYQTFRFQTPDSDLSGNEIKFRFTSQADSNVVVIDKIIIKEGSLQFNSLPEIPSIQTNTRYDSTAKKWQVTHNGGESWGTMGGTTAADMAAAVEAYLAAMYTRDVSYIIDAGTVNGVTLPWPVEDIRNVSVYFDGERQHNHTPGEIFTMPAPWTIDFTSTQSVGLRVLVESFDSGVGKNNIIVRHETIMTSSTTDILVPWTYDINEIAVYINGDLYQRSEYSYFSPYVIRMDSALSIDDEVVVFKAQIQENTLWLLDVNGDLEPLT